MCSLLRPFLTSFRLFTLQKVVIRGHETRNKRKTLCSEKPQMFANQHTEHEFRK